ncbi:hypothetical protein [Pseudonocardia sp.]|jgi:hypothetical protein|uniref:hypothetical protein n=1 Tax=Pseudonocardia sp. TaxID=60912 RepID=UPI0031FBE5B8
MSSADAGDEITFRVTTQEGQLILEALGALRFSLVYQLIGKLQGQAQAQLGDAPEDDS